MDRLFDFGLYFSTTPALYGNFEASGPYFYLPKLESHLEARLWNERFPRGPSPLGISAGTIKATVLIETLWPHSRWVEILYELRGALRGPQLRKVDDIFSFGSRAPSNDAATVIRIASRSPWTRASRAYSQLLYQDLSPSGRARDGWNAGYIP